MHPHLLVVNLPDLYHHHRHFHHLHGNSDHWSIFVAMIRVDMPETVSSENDGTISYLCTRSNYRLSGFQNTCFFSLYE